MLPHDLQRQKSDSVGSARQIARAAARPGVRQWYWPAIFILVALILLPSYRHAINPDGVAYISLSRDWVVGRWSAAASPHWSPLLPWLIAPLLQAGLEPRVASRLVLVLASAVALGLVGCLLRRADTPWMIAVPTMATAFALLLSWTLAGPITPDVLSVVGVLAVVLVMTGAWQSRRSWCLAGLFGGIGYLAKSALLPWFVGLLLLVCVLHGRRQHRPVLMPLALALGTAVAVASPWVMALSLKTGELTTGTAGSYTFAFKGPRSTGHAIDERLIAPPAGELTAWVDPSQFAPPSWSPFSSTADAQHFVRLVADNARAGAHQLEPLLPVVLLCLVLGGVSLLHRTRLAGAPAVAVVLIASGLLLALYLPVHVQQRYLWPVILLMITVQALLAQRVPRNYRPVVAAVLVAALVPVVGHSKASLDREKGSGRADDVLARQLLNADDRPRRLAANKFDLVHASFLVDIPFFGSTGSARDPQEIDRALDNFHVDTYVWYASEGPAPSLPAWRSEQGVGGVVIYRRKR